jgi:hypothetical protein
MIASVLRSFPGVERESAPSTGPDLFFPPLAITISGVRTVHEDAFFAVQLDEARKLVLVTRSKEPFPRIDDVRTSITQLVGAIQSLDRASLALLLDLRAGPARNDEDFEKVVGTLPQGTAGFRARATLVRSAAGRLQIQRIGRTHGRSPAVFTDEAEALAFLCAP